MHQPQKLHRKNFNPARSPKQKLISLPLLTSNEIISHFLFFVPHPQVVSQLFRFSFGAPSREGKSARLENFLTQKTEKRVKECRDKRITYYINFKIEKLSFSQLSSSSFASVHHHFGISSGKEKKKLFSSSLSSVCNVEGGANVTTLSHRCFAGSLNFSMKLSLPSLPRSVSMAKNSFIDSSRLSFRTGIWVTSKAEAVKFICSACSRNGKGSKLCSASVMGRSIN